MNCQEKHNELEQAMEELNAKGFDGMGSAIQILFNHAMLIERERHLNAASYERSENRQGYANGYKPKRLKHVLVPWSLTFLKLGMEIFIRLAWKKECVPKGLCGYLWRKCMCKGYQLVK